MRIAVVGSGIAGLASAWELSRSHEVTLFEQASYLGGHTHTHEVRVAGVHHVVDTGFIVHNRAHYPLLSALFDELGVATRPTTMSFSVRNEGSGLEYNAAHLRGLFCQSRNLLSPAFWGMLRDLARFYREAPALLDTTGPGPTLGEFLDSEGYGAAFRDDHLVPMASALWSSPSRQILGFPARYLVQFMVNHQMLDLGNRPQWRVVEGGSSSYIKAMRQRWHVRERLNCAVLAVRRLDEGVELELRDGTERFDHVVLACHSDQALHMLADPDFREREILGALPYQVNDTVLHTDASVLPRRRRAWAAWNAHVGPEANDPCTVSYCMNLLQGIASAEPLIVTLNRTDAIDPARILRRMHYSHPVQTHAAVAAKARKHEIQGKRNTWFAGAYWGWGFHEDGMRSAHDVVQALGATAGCEALA
ncbi:NAD(P)/FAD-dependent oxidoreductase [Pinirhizobacter sp.]|jgi:hypothetical protein|uniref:NAD(P)/FAD-dependent oxidoreductase n=1 Tax=Pinirhizobacter sp. TaxID=2950432 RepID=UPI002F40A9DF